VDVILGLRDRYYGHTDSPLRKAEVQHNDLTIDQVEPLIEMAESIIKEIYQKVFDTDAYCRVDASEKDFDIITILTEHKQAEIKRILGPRFKVKDK